MSDLIKNLETALRQTTQIECIRILKNAIYQAKKINEKL